jgi:hypothetical protein
MLRLCFGYIRNRWEINNWSYLVAAFPVDEYYVIVRPKDELIESGFLKKAKIIRTADELPKEPELVVAAPKKGRFIQGSVDLKDFKHPEDAIYMFGFDNVHLSEDELGSREPDHVVYIDAESRWELFAHVAAAIFLYDIKVKS